MATSSPSSPTEAVLATLEQQGKSSLISILGKAQWNWDGARLELVFAGSAASLATLAGQPSTRKTLTAACVAALGRSPEISIAARPESDSQDDTPAGPPAPPGSPEDRAAQHPLLQQLKEKIPSHVLRTRLLPIQ